MSQNAAQMPVTNPDAVAGRPNGVLGVKPFRRYLGLRFISLIGDGAWWIALAWEAGKIGHGGGIGVVMGIGGIPRLLLTFVGGSLADKFGIKKTMITSDLLAAAITGVGAALWFSGVHSLAVLAALAFCFGVVDSFYGPSSMAFSRALLDDDQLARGSSVRQTAAGIAALLGTLSGGLIVSVGFEWVALFDAVTFVVVGIGLMLVRPTRPIPERRTVAGGKLGSLLREAIGQLWSSSVIRSILMSALILNVLGLALINVGIVARVQQLGWPSGALVAIDMSMAVAMTLSGVVLAKYDGFRRPGLTAIMCSIALSGLILGTFLSANIVLSCSLSFLTGILMTPVISLTNALAMKSVPAEIAGALNGAMMTVSMGSVPFGSFLFGVLTVTAGLQVAGLSTGLLLIAGSVLLLAVAPLRNAVLVEEKL